MEPEGIALMDMGGRTYAFIGAGAYDESAVAIFDITNPNKTRFVDMIVTAGDVSPDGVAGYKYQGQYYLAIANEVIAPGAATSNTTLYRLGRVLPRP